MRRHVYFKKGFSIKTHASNIWRTLPLDSGLSFYFIFKLCLFKYMLLNIAKIARSVMASLRITLGQISGNTSRQFRMI